VLTEILIQATLENKETVALTILLQVKQQKQ
jgi:hypothetical protein